MQKVKNQENMKKRCFIPLPTPEDAEHVFFVRENIESQAARSATIHASEE